MSSWTYRNWSRALQKHYFSEQRAGEPVLFLVDDDHLQEIHPSGRGSEAASSLAEVVRGRMDFGHPGGEFHRIESEARGWRRGDPAVAGPLPLLGLCVLAASRMGSGAVSAANYREHFCGLLGLPKDALPAGYGQSVPTLWDLLDQWLEATHAGSRGHSTIVKSTTQPWIGYALSQTLFLSADVARLADFFEAIELEPGEQIEGPELLAYFRAWAPARGLSKGARFMMESADHAVGLERILLGHARRWDGTRVPGSSERRGFIRVVVDPFPLRVELAAERGEGLPESATVRTPDGRRMHMSSSSGEWYDSVPLPVDASTLRRGASLQGTGFTLALRGGEVHVLRLDHELGGWGSVPSVRVAERHWILLTEEAWRQAGRWLRDHGGDECREDESLGRVLPGWRLVRDVVMERPPATPPPAGMACLSPSVRHRVALEGGLPLQRGSGTYLLDGPPDLWRPMAGEEGALPAVLLSNSAERDLPSDSLCVRLADLDPPLRHGEHVIRASGALRRSLTLVPSTRHAPPPTVHSSEHRLALTATGRVGSHQPPSNEPASPDEAIVSGARVVGGRATVEPPQPVLVNRRARYAVILGLYPGEREGVPPLRHAPRWMAELGLSDRFGDFAPSFEPAWVIETWDRAPRRRARAVSRQAPGAPVADRDAVDAWAEELLEIDMVRDRDGSLLRQYVAVAEAIRR